ncbi:MAG: WXG100 family type VII secretion target [Nonomuraea sp.]|nr:WXG100 family type VII secretion target [Nonomuraea sp.]
MGADKYGAKLAELEAMGKVFGQQGEAAQAMKAKLDSQAGKIPDIWSGPNADKFKTAWESYKKTFDDLQRTLSEAQQGIQKNKQAIAAATGAA